MDTSKIEDEDLYEILEISLESTEADIKKAYRKRALKLHPDKNPDNPNAAKEFHKLSKILEILTDETARKAYDRVLKGRKEAALRHRALDSKRKKMKEDLEAREHAAKREKSAQQTLQEEIERLRKEGSRLVEEEIAFVTKQIYNERNSKTADKEDSGNYRIKIKWKASKTDSNNGGYPEETLKRILLKYGDITALVISSKKRGSAMVEYGSKRAAEMAVDIEAGFPENPLKLEWVNPPSSLSRPGGSAVNDRDFESLVLMKLRQAEERKRLIAEMMAADNE